MRTIVSKSGSSFGRARLWVSMTLCCAAVFGVSANRALARDEVYLDYHIIDGYNPTLQDIQAWTEAATGNLQRDDGACPSCSPCDDVPCCFYFRIGSIDYNYAYPPYDGSLHIINNDEERFHAMIEVVGLCVPALGCEVFVWQDNLTEIAGSAAPCVEIKIYQTYGIGLILPHEYGHVVELADRYLACGQVMNAEYTADNDRVSDEECYDHYKADNVPWPWCP